jgi:hypothetical protein
MALASNFSEASMLQWNHRFARLVALAVVVAAVAGNGFWFSPVNISW